MSQASHVKHPHGPDLYVTVPATAGPAAESFATYLGYAWSWYVPGAISVIRELGADGMLAAHNGIPSMSAAQKAAVGDWLVPVDRDHNGVCDDIVLVRHGQKWRTLKDERRGYAATGFNAAATFEGHAVRFVIEFAACHLKFLNQTGSVACEYSANTTKHDGSGSYIHAGIAAGSVADVFGNLFGAGIVSGEFIKRADGRWVGTYSGFINISTDGNITNMGGDYWSVEGRLVFSAGTPIFGFNGPNGENASFSLHMEVKG